MCLTRFCELAKNGVKLELPSHHESTIIMTPILQSSDAAVSVVWLFVFINPYSNMTRCAETNFFLCAQNYLGQQFNAVQSGEACPIAIFLVLVLLFFFVSIWFILLFMLLFIFVFVFFFVSCLVFYWDIMAGTACC